MQQRRAFRYPGERAVCFADGAAADEAARDIRLHITR
jgi:hypothetical protein